MAATATKLMFEFDRKFDRFNSQYKKNLRHVDKVAVLNEALRAYINDRAFYAEVTEEIRRLLSPLEVKNKKLEIVDQEDKYTTVALPEDFFKRLGQRAVISKPELCEEKEIPLIILQSDDAIRSRKNPNWKSSYEWEHALFDEAANMLYLWHEGDFKFTEVYLDYIKRHPDIHVPSLADGGKYEDWDGIVQVEDQGMLIDGEDIVTDLATWKARVVIGDVRDSQIEQNSILQLQRTNFSK